MSGNSRFILDANIFIEAKKRYYSFTLCPGYWKALVAHHKSGRVVSIDKVHDELKDEGDELSNWASEETPETFFKLTQDIAVVSAFQEIVNWVYSETQFTEAAKAEFASVADGWIVAYAKVNGLLVVTHEEYSADAKKKVPIPNVCLEFNIKHVNTFEMLNDLKVKFVLSTKRTRGK
jgi:hypothetical protein